MSLFFFGCLTGAFLFIVAVLGVRIGSKGLDLKLPVECRDGGFEMDLEDLMVMEAIWLSIQVIPYNIFINSLEEAQAKLCVIPNFTFLFERE